MEENDYKKLKKQPLKFVLAEFRFSPVLEIDKSISKIQETLRRQYPILDKNREQAIQMQPGGIAVSAVDRWTFVSADKKSAIDLNQERLVYITAEYQRFADFSDSFKQAVRALASNVDLGLSLRIGLRYSNLVKVDENEKISDFVNEHFAYPSCFESFSKAQQQRTETILQTDIGALIIRTLYGEHSLTCLPDVQSLPILVNHDAIEKQSERIILDFDHIWSSKDESVFFEENQVIETLKTLHENSRKAFWEMTTDYARNEKWL